MTKLKAQPGEQVPRVLLEWHLVRGGLVALKRAKEQSSTWSLERQRHKEQPVAWGEPFLSTSHLWKTQ